MRIAIDRSRTLDENAPFAEGALFVAGADAEAAGLEKRHVMRSFDFFLGAKVQHLRNVDAAHDRHNRRAR